MTVDYRDLPKSRVDEAIRLVRNGFQEDVIALTIYGQKGIGKYVEDQLGGAGIRTAKNFLGAFDTCTNELLGFAEFSIEGDCRAHLSYITVAPHARRMGIGRGLIDAFVSSVPTVETITLDVFSENVPAIRLYEIMGFVTNRFSAWFLRDLPSASTTVPVRVGNWPQAVASHQRFGFSSFTVEMDGEVFYFGLLGAETLRTQSKCIFEDDDVLATLRGAFPTVDRVLLVLSDFEPQSTVAGRDPVVVSNRMSWRIVRSESKSL